MASTESNGSPSNPDSDLLSNCIPSILDTDLYKLTMQQAVLRFYPTSRVSYKFTNRSNKTMKFNLESFQLIQSRINLLGNLKLTQEERNWLQETCPYLSKDYLDFLQNFRYDPLNQVKCHFKEDNQSGVGDLELEIKGLWKDVILYEVPIMAIVSQSYFETVDTDWEQEGTRELAQSKASRLASSGVLFSEFGTRRRRSYQIQKTVISGLLSGIPSSSSGKLLGTSNVHFAQLFNLNPIGTIAHEWTMALAALSSYKGSNSKALETWDQIYSPPNFEPKNPGQDLTIALTDTFSTKVFWKEMMESEEGGEESRDRLRRWRGVRQDSGDSKEFARLASQKYLELGVDPLKKVVIYSDGLDVERCLELQAYSKEIGIGSGFGIGTNLTNDFKQKSDPKKTSKPLNIVIKLSSINDLPVVKISDDLTKNTGDEEEVRMVKRRFGLNDGSGEEIEDA